MDHVVKLEALPDGLTFPPEFQGRIRHDASSRRLIFRGFMSKMEFDQLCELSENWSYRRSLEDLFRLCVPEPAPRQGGILRGLFSSLAGFWIG